MEETKDINVIKQEIDSLLTVKEVAKLLSCSESFVYTLFNNGTLDGVRWSPRYIRFRKSDIDTLLKTKININKEKNNK